MNKRYVLAVSGGVDSVALLHKFRQKFQPGSLIVAHFDHGIREDSAADARFVAGLAARYGLRCEVERQELGADASEALAREARYGFLKRLAKKYDATLVTAHHSDDVAESIAINIVRGTGWRGLAVMGDKSIHRPLLSFTKEQLIEYALKNRLEWVEDETNSSDAYLRNIIRRLIALKSIQAANLGNLRARQLIIREQIDLEVRQLLEDNPARRRYFLTMVDDDSADELLRQLLLEATGTPLTRPQRQRMLSYIKVGRPGSQVELGESVTMRLSRGEFDISIT